MRFDEPVSGLFVQGEALPYGEPNTFPQNIKNLAVSNGLPWPNKGPHHSLASELPLNA